MVAEMLRALQHSVGSAVDEAMARSAKHVATDVGISGVSTVLMQSLPVHWQPVVSASLAYLRAWGAGPGTSYLTDVQTLMFNLEGSVS